VIYENRTAVNSFGISGCFDLSQVLFYKQNSKGILFVIPTVGGI
jgi:hypothetical protein